MSKSLRFRALTKELNRLKKQFLPKINPIGFYSDRQLALTIAYRVLAHAEIEAYLEERVWEVVLNAKKSWNRTSKPCRTLISLVAFSGRMMESPPDTLNPMKGSKSIVLEKIKLDRKIDSTISSFKRVIDQNHGVKEANLLALLLPIGIDSDDLDSALLATMNAFGEQRGIVAHSSAISYKTIQPPDPATELSRVQQITAGLLLVDELITDLKR